MGAVVKQRSDPLEQRYDPQKGQYHYHKDDHHDDGHQIIAAQEPSLSTYSDQ